MLNLQLILSLFVYCMRLAVLQETSEYCQLETFQPKCSGINEVVQITSATYGRMEIGKCISQEELSGTYGEDPKYFGCKSDVIDILHRKCSLKPSCEIKIPNADLDKTKPCLPGLRFYLQVAYKCINVVDQDTNCVIQASTSIPKHFTLHGLLNNTSCGTTNRPWTIEASRGQKIQISLITLNENIDQLQSNCGYEIGIFSDGLKNITLCSGGKFNSAIRGVNNFIYEDGTKFTTSSSMIELIVFKKLRDYQSDETLFNGYMLIKFEADGCLDIIPPEDTWLKRTNDDIVIGCYSSKQTWYLRCENKKWTGTIGNCSQNLKQENRNTIIEKPRNKHMDKEQQILVIVAITGIMIIICSVIICIGAVCLKRYTKKGHLDNLYIKQPVYYPSVNGNTLTKTIHSYDNQDNKSINMATAYEDANDYKENNYFVLEDAK